MTSADAQSEGSGSISSSSSVNNDASAKEVRSFDAMSKKIDDDDSVSDTINDLGNGTARNITIPEAASSSTGPVLHEDTVADISRATENSLRDAVGAFHVQGSNSANSNIQGGVGTLHSNATQPSAESPDASNLYSNGSLPPNIDIIAEATLVVEHDTDMDTLGLRWGDEPRVGGADVDDTVSVAVSAITSPAFPPAAIHTQILTSGDDIESAGESLPVAAAVRTLSSQITDATLNNTAASTPVTGEAAGDTDEGNHIYEATLIDDGPLAFLQSKSGRIVVGVSGILIILLSVGLAAGLTHNKESDTAALSISTGDGGMPKVQVVTVRVPTQEERDSGVLVFAGGDFCGGEVEDIVPQEFYDTFDSCGLGLIMPQAVANAQRIPHPFCDINSGESVSPHYIPGKTKPVTSPDPSLCQMSNRKPHISLLNLGAIRGAGVFKGDPVTNSTIANIMPFTMSSIAYLRLSPENLVKVLNNAMNYATQDDPWCIRHFAAVPIASGLRWDPHFYAPAGEKVSNIEVLVSDINSPRLEVWVPIESSTRETYVVVTNNWIASGGDGYLDGIEPEYIAITSLSYNEELKKYLSDLKGNWMPPTMPPTHSSPIRYIPTNLNN